MEPRDGAAAALLHACLEAFDSRDAMADVDLRVTLATTPDLEPLSAGHDDTPTVERIDERTLQISRRDCAAEWDVVERRMIARLWPCAPSVASLLRVACALALPPRGGLLLHAASVVGVGGAFVIPGPSGAGKTTLAHLAHPRAVLSDEISAVRLVDSRYRCFPTPFWGAMPARAPGPPAPVTAVLLPVKDAVLHLDPVSPARALARLLRCALSFAPPQEPAGAILDAATGIAALVPGYEVRFALTQSPWSLLDAISHVSAA